MRCSPHCALNLFRSVQCAFRIPLPLFSFPLILVFACISTTALSQPAATFTPLGSFGGAAQTQAHDVSADGSVVVGVATNYPDRSHAVFRWTKDGSVLHKGETVRSKVAVSDDGTTIVGSRY